MTARAHIAVRAGGFTLLEVLAAVLVLGVLYTVLAGSQIQGLRSEGESRRRLEASLLVDELMTELEATLATGETPPIGTSESENGPYVVVMDVQPFDLVSHLGEIVGEEAAALATEQIASPLLLTPDRPEDSVLREVDVAVRWMEAEGEHEVRRTTLVYDAATVAGLFPEADEDGGPPEIDEDAIVNPDGSANIEEMKRILQQLGGGSQ